MTDRDARDFCVSARGRQILDRLARTTDPRMIQRLSYLILLLEMERRAHEPLTGSDPDRSIDDLEQSVRGCPEEKK